MQKKKSRQQHPKKIIQSMLNDANAQVVKVRKTGVMVNVLNRRELLSDIFTQAQTKAGVLNPQRFHRLRHRKI